MAVYNLGSINLDHIYKVPHLPAPGETLAANGYSVGLGGKGANQAVAVAKAGARSILIGAVGAEGAVARDALVGYGVDVSRVTFSKTPTGHAIINVDPQAENAIVIYAGANLSITGACVAQALADATGVDSFLLQNETSAQVEAARIAAGKGMRVVYSAAPFDIDAVRAILPFVSMLAMNEGEAAALIAELGTLPQIDMVVTKGSKGAEWISAGLEPLFVPSFPVKPVDTTGAGDTFIGTLIAGLDVGLDRSEAMRRAAAAAAIQVTRPGAAPAIPDAAEVDAFLLL